METASIRRESQASRKVTQRPHHTRKKNNTQARKLTHTRAIMHTDADFQMYRCFRKRHPVKVTVALQRRGPAFLYLLRETFSTVPKRKKARRTIRAPPRSCGQGPLNPSRLRLIPTRGPAHRQRTPRPERIRAARGWNARATEGR